MNSAAKIYVAGHRGLVGSALVRALTARGYDNLVVRTRAELDLTDGAQVRRFWQQERPEYVFLAAARVGGILANNSRPADFIRENLAIQNNVIFEAYNCGVERLLFLGSSCIYPKHCPQPIQERCLLGGPLEPTNRPYAVAKIAGVEMCWAYNRQYGTQFLAAMPTNLYGPGDNYDLETSHVIAALLRKMLEAQARGESRVTAWGTGAPRREFLYVDDMAAACVFLMELPDEKFLPLLGSEEEPPLVNIGAGEDQTIAEVAALIAEVVGYRGEVVFDPAKPDGTPRKLLEVSRMRELGWRPAVSLRRGLELTAEAWRSSKERS